MHRFYCFRIDKWGNHTHERPSLPRVEESEECPQRKAVKAFSEGGSCKRSKEPFWGYVVLHLPFGPSRFEARSWNEDKFATLDWEYWVYDKQLQVMGDGEGPPYVP